MDTHRGDDLHALVARLYPICRSITGDGVRETVLGANWSAAIHNPFRTFGDTGEGLEAFLSEQRAGVNEPIVLVLHLAHPRVEYTDRGKSALVISNGVEHEH